jgi:D-glycero-D-manno-heptose 1,7-bisphosphate phosphatase
MVVTPALNPAAPPRGGLHRRCVFLDRDGVINRKASDGEYIRTWKEFHFLPGIVDWIRLFNALELLVVVITNQRGVARGLIRNEDLEEIHRNMIRELASAGARIDDLFYCPHAEDTCECRKPRPGMVLEAQRKWNIDLAGSLLIGDSERDRLLAETCRLTFVRAADGRVVDVVPALEGRSA